MAMSMQKSWSATAVIFAALLMGGISPAAVPQEPGRPPVSEEERRRIFERLTRQLQGSQQNAKQPPGPVMEQSRTPASAPVPAPASSSTPIPPVSKAPIPPVRSIQAGSSKVQLNFENEPLYDFINQIASTLSLTPIVIDPEVKGTVNIQSSLPMSTEDVLPLFNIILKNNNAALVKQNGIYQIVPISSALKKGLDIIDHLPSPPSDDRPPEEIPGMPEAIPSKTGKVSSGTPGVKAALSPQPAQAKTVLSAPPKSQSGEAADSGAPRLATHIVRVNFVPVKDLIEPIKMFMTDGGVIMPYERENMLILTDYSDSAARILKIIHMLDSSYLDPDLIELVKIKNNASADVLEDLKKVFGSGAKDSMTGIQLISLDRINAIFVMTNSKTALSEVKHWIELLDSTSGKNIQTFVYVVQNSTASNIAMMLSALYGGEGSSSETSGDTDTRSGAQGRLSSSRSSFFGGSDNRSGLNDNQSTFGDTGGNYMGGSAFGGGQQLGPRLNDNRTISAQTLRGGSFAGLQDEIRMVVDNVNNSLIFQATPADYAYISETVKKMDVLPRQAIIDARIFEVDLTDALSFGIAGFLQGRTEGQHLTTGSMGALDAAGNVIAGPLAVNTFAFVGNSREILLNIDALRSKTKVKILEAPSVLALDGTEARIVVGAEIPYPGTSFTPSVGGTTTSVQYRDTGISLLVLPRISASGSVTLNVAQEVSSPGTTSSVDNAPTFSKTLVQTTLSVKDGETVAIAGLIRDNKNFARAGVPFLSEIPIVGSLFGSTKTDSRRTELIILLTPHVIRTPEKFQEMTRQLKDSLRHVRKFADEEEKKHVEDMEEARKDRYKKEQERMKSVAPERRRN